MTFITATNHVDLEAMSTSGAHLACGPTFRDSTPAHHLRNKLSSLQDSFSDPAVPGALMWSAS